MAACHYHLSQVSRGEEPGQKQDLEREEVRAGNPELQEAQFAPGTGKKMGVKDRFVLPQCCLGPQPITSGHTERGSTQLKEDLHPFLPTLEQGKGLRSPSSQVEGVA